MADKIVENIVTYFCSDAEFIKREHRACRFLTSLCPNHCNHAQTVLTFLIHALDVQVNPASTNAQFVTPVSAGDVHHISARTLPPELLEVASSLQAGDRVIIAWRHDYVTQGGCSAPQHNYSTL